MPHKSIEPKSVGHKMARVLRAMVVLGVLLGADPALAGRRIWMCGDSKAANFLASRFPAAGWVQVLQPYFDASKIQVRNLAVAGATSVSFKTLPNWKLICDSIKVGDYMFVQFGTNDFTSGMDSATYESELDSFARAARQRGAIPVFLTPHNSSKWNRDTVFETLRQPGANFAQWLSNVAARDSIPLLDLQRLSAAGLDSLGPNYSWHFHYMFFAAWEFPGYWVNGSSNYNHFQQMGALWAANLFKVALQKASSPVLRELQDALVGCDSLVVRSTPGEALLHTHSDCYPKGSILTLKAYPDTLKGLVFAGWADSSGKQIDTARIHRDTLRGRLVRRALFAKSADTGHSTSLAPFELRGRELLLGPVQSVRAWDLEGHPVALLARTAGRLRFAHPGVVVVRGVTPQGPVIRRMVIPEGGL